MAPNFLRALCRFSYGDGSIPADTLHAHVTGISIGGFFFAMRSCEHSITPALGRTKLIAFPWSLSTSPRTLDPPTWSCLVCWHDQLWFILGLVNLCQHSPPDQRAHQWWGLSAQHSNLLLETQRVFHGRTIDGIGGTFICCHSIHHIACYLLGWLGHWKLLGQTSFGSCTKKKN